MSIAKKPKQRFYYNVSIPHNDLISVGGSPTPANFVEVRDQALFNGSPKDWTMSVIRFTIPTSFIPIQFFPVEPDPVNPTNPNKSIYSITLSYLGVDYQVFLEWVTQDSFITPPPPPTGIVNVTEPVSPEYYIYYSLYSYNHFCDLINTALDKAFQNNIVPLLPAGNYKSPYFYFDGATNLFTLVTTELFLDTTTNNIEIWLNTSLNGNFDTSFDVVYSAFDAPKGKNIRYKILDRGYNIGYVDPQTGEALYEQKQEFDSTGQFSSFTSIILRSVSLPIVNEAISLQPRGGQIKGSGVAGGSEAIISDFEIDLGTGRNLKSFIHYNPTAEFRRITLHGDTPITRIDIQILWKDNYDNLFPVLIPAHDIATVKILFETLD